MKSRTDVARLRTLSFRLRMQTKSPWFIFLLVAVAQFMVVLDASITNVALPAIKASLGFSTAALQWVVTSYALTFGGFLLLGGRAADLFGHKRVLIAGLSGFTVVSFLIGVSQSATMLIVLRSLQGVCGALMSPAALSVILLIFAEGKDRNRALSLWTTVATGGAAVGLVLGGILTQYAGWRWNFFLNVPVGIAVVLAIRTHLEEQGARVAHRHLDLPGAALVTLGLMLLVFVISKAPAWGWLSPLTLGSAAVTILLLGGFVWNESISKHPLMPLSIFKVRNLTGANLMMAPIMAGMFGMFYLISLYVQNVLAYTPFLAGLCFLPFPLILGSLSTTVGRAVTRFGYRPFLIIGPSLVALSMLWLTRLPVVGNYWIDIFPTIILMPIGLSMTFMPIMLAATSGIPPDEAGLAAGLINTSQQMGGALGLAILSSVAAAVAASHAGLGKSEALVAGYDHAFLIALLFVVGATVLGLLIIRQKKGVPGADAPVVVHTM
jgi:EmrB/QacA subfamily drug resistance transporter